MATSQVKELLAIFLGKGATLMKNLSSICVAVLLIACTTQAQQRGIQKEISQQPALPASAQRVALVIGNSAYNVAPL
ncbi:MAG TPA: hypothetical protein VE775_01200, partial [Pyrinomonadaceae bacterium]|nr:hypothetical protein [Pyrinomonadaceae bacterium]